MTAPGAMPVWAVCFDAFGTLVEIADRRGPYRPWVRASVAAGIDPLTVDASFEEWAARCGASLEEVAVGVEALAAEIASIRFRPSVAEAVGALVSDGIAVGVCSNLATPYGPPLLAALPFEPAATVLSYEAGLRKPDPAIYALVASRLGLRPAEILFVGDTPAADVEGPRAAGMRSIHVRDFESLWPAVVRDPGAFDALP